MAPSTRGGPTDRRNPRPPTDRPAIDPRIRQRRAAVRRGEGRRRLRVLVAVVATLAVLGGGAALLHTSFFAARVITVTGAHPHTSTATIVAAAGLERRPLMIDVDPGVLAARVSRLPFVATARIIRHWPDGIQVVVRERVPVATMAGPGTSWSEVDGSGRVLQVQPTRPAGLVQLVVMTGKGMASPGAVGGTIRGRATVGLQVCRTLPLAFSAQVMTVTVTSDNTVDLALNSGLSVELGSVADLSAKYHDVASIIAYGALMGKNVIDVTVPGSPTVT